MADIDDEVGGNSSEPGQGNAADVFAHVPDDVLAANEQPRSTEGTDGDGQDGDMAPFAGVAGEVQQMSEADVHAGLLYVESAAASSSRNTADSRAEATRW
eukprot:3551828-Alexandrium_andersonii.AAC.1